MIAIPEMTPAIAIWCFPYFSAVGKSSSSEIYIIIPATAANTNGKAAPPALSSTPKMAVIARQSKAPRTSLNPERVA